MNPDTVAEQLLAGPLPSRSRLCVMCPDEHLIDADLCWIGANQGQILTCLDAGFPSQLRRVAGEPAALYRLGAAEVLARPTLAMVGSRHTIPAALDTARTFASGLMGTGPGMVSDLADRSTPSFRKRRLPPGCRAWRCAPRNWTGFNRRTRHASRHSCARAAA